MRLAALAFGLALGICPPEAGAWQARIEATDADAARLLELAADLRDRQGLDRAGAEQALGGVRLSETDHTDAFVFLAAANLPLGGLRLARVDFREPVPGGPATAGPLLVLDVEGPCVRRETIERRFGRLALTDAPDGHSLDERAVWSLVLPNRTLGFGFPERDADCLGTVSLGFRSPPGKEGSH